MSGEDSPQQDTDVFMPDRPRMGGLVQSSKDTYVPWTGGKPKPDWKGLDDKAKDHPVRSLQLRTFTDKRYLDRVTGPVEKFDKKKGDFSRLQDELVRHFMKHGMDTIMYLLDPLSKSSMLNIVTEHPRFTHTKVREAMKQQVSMYDKYDANNDAAAQDYLLDSLDKTFRREVEDQSRDVASFPELFMIIVRIITDDSIEHWEIVKSEMRSLDPHNYAGHDITALTTDFAAKARSLTAAGLYDHTLTASLLTNLLKAEWPPTPKFSLLLLNKSVQDSVDHIRFLDRAAADQYMTTNKLLYTHVIEEANSKYWVSVKRGEWSAKSTHRDSKAPPTSYGANNATVSKKGKQTKSIQANALVQQMNTPGNKKTYVREKGKNNNNKNKNNNNFTKRTSSSDNNWRRIPPKEGEPEMRMVDGKPMYWCGKCTNWNPTHKTSEHIVGFKSNKSSSKQHQANKLEMEPAAWAAYIEKNGFDDANTYEMVNKEHSWLFDHDDFEANCVCVKCPPNMDDAKTDVDCSETDDEYDLCAYNLVVNLTQTVDTEEEMDDGSSTSSSLFSSNTLNLVTPDRITSAALEQEEQDSETTTSDMQDSSSCNTTSTINTTEPTSTPIEPDFGNEPKYFNKWEELGPSLSALDSEAVKFSDLETQRFLEGLYDKEIQAAAAVNESYESMDQDTKDTSMANNDTYRTPEASMDLSVDDMNAPLKMLQQGRPPSLEKKLPAISPILPQPPLPPRPSAPFALAHQAPSPPPQLPPRRKLTMQQPIARYSSEQFVLEAEQAKRDGMRYERAAKTVFANAWREPKLTVAEAYQRVKEEEWAMGYYVDGTLIPNHPRPEHSFPGMSPIPPGPMMPCFNIQPMDTSSISHRFTPASTQLRTHRESSADSLSSTSFTPNNTTLGEKYVPTDADTASSGGDSAKTVPLTKYFANMAWVDDCSKNETQNFWIKNNESEGGPQDRQNVPIDTMEETVSSDEDSLVGKCVEVHYTPFRFGHVTPSPVRRDFDDRLARESDETPTAETSAWLHLFLVALAHLVLVLPVIQWLYPTASPSTGAHTYYNEGKTTIYIGLSHFLTGIYDLYTGLWFLLLSYVTHPSFMPAIITWLSCWIVVLVVIRRVSSRYPDSPWFGHHPNYHVNRFKYRLARIHTRNPIRSKPQSLPPPSLIVGFCFSALRLIVVLVCRLLGLSASTETGGPLGFRGHVTPLRGRNRNTTNNRHVYSGSSRHNRKRRRVPNRPPSAMTSTPPTNRRRMPTSHRCKNRRSTSCFQPSTSAEPTINLTGNTRQRSNTRNSSNFCCNLSNVPFPQVPNFYPASPLNQNKFMGMAMLLQEPPRCHHSTTELNHHPWEHITQQALRAALQDPSKLRSSMPSHASYPIIWDSGASVCITNDEKDFVGPIRSLPSLQVKGIANRMKATARGTVVWTILDTNGMPRSLKLPAFLVPKTSVRLLSTQSLLQTYFGEKIIQDGYTLTLTGIPGDESRREVTVMVNPSNNLPMSFGYDKQNMMTGSVALNTTVNEVSQHNENLTAPQKELLKWHYRLGHLNFRKVQFLMRTGILATTEKTRRLHSQAASLLQDLPLCAACQFGKQRRRTEPGSTTTIVKDRRGVTKDGNLHPGQCISVDHFVCSTKGRRFDSRGKSKVDNLYVGGAIFVDHASGYTWIGFQSHLNTHETLSVKGSFELFCREVGVVPLKYLTDNGAAFTSKSYSQSLENFAQISRFAGVGAHHHANTNNYVDCTHHDVTLCHTVARIGRSGALAHGRFTCRFLTQPCTQY